MKVCFSDSLFSHHYIFPHNFLWDFEHGISNFDSLNTCVICHRGMLNDFVKVA